MAAGGTNVRGKRDRNPLLISRRMFIDPQERASYLQTFLNGCHSVLAQPLSLSLSSPHTLCMVCTLHISNADPLPFPPSLPVRLICSNSPQRAKK